MPTYDYRCKKCNHEFEAFHSMSDEPLKVCPRCKKHSLQRLIGAGAGIIFKGNGFYITDYKRGSSSSSGPKKASKSTSGTEKSDSSAGSED